MQITALLYTGGRLRDPFDPTLWSGTASRFFTELARRNRLHRAIGISLAPLSTFRLALKYPHWSRHVISARVQTLTAYREGLSSAVARELGPADLKGPCFQIGAMFNVARAVDGRGRCFSYHDGCLIERLHSPLPPPPLPARELDKTVAFEGDVYRSMDRVFTFSAYLRESLIRHYGLGEDRVAVLGAGLNLDQVPAPSPNKRYDSKEILFIGVEFERKGGPQLLRAFRTARARHPTAILHVVGPRQLTIPPELSANVHYHGFLSKREPHSAALLEQLFHKSCLFVMPSLYEPFGIAPLEAMANGVPALVSDGWALREIVEPGVTGDRVEVGNEDELAVRIMQMLSAPELLQEMGERARPDVLERYRWENVIARLLTAIDAHVPPPIKHQGQPRHPTHWVRG
jgi:alpha-maltose-1-phosphate synthase